MHLNVSRYIIICNILQHSFDTICASDLCLFHSLLILQKHSLVRVYYIFVLNVFDLFRCINVLIFAQHSCISVSLSNKQLTLDFIPTEMKINCTKIIDSFNNFSIYNRFRFTNKTSAKTSFAHFVLVIISLRLFSDTTKSLGSFIRCLFVQFIWTECILYWTHSCCVSFLFRMRKKCTINLMQKSFKIVLKNTRSDVYYLLMWWSHFFLEITMIIIWHFTLLLFLNFEFPQQLIMDCDCTLNAIYWSYQMQIWIWIVFVYKLHCQVLIQQN